MRDLSSSEIIYFSTISRTLVAFAAETSLSFAESKQELTQQAPLGAWRIKHSHKIFRLEELLEVMETGYFLTLQEVDGERLGKFDYISISQAMFKYF